MGNKPEISGTDTKVIKTTTKLYVIDSAKSAESAENGIK